MKIKVYNESPNSLPQYETSGAAGLDVKANENVTIKPGERVLVKTGLFVEIPEGYELMVRPRSGLAIKHGITVLNSPGCVDPDYRGNVGVILINHGSSDFEIRVGDRIAQLVLNKVEKIDWQTVISKDELSSTNRGSGGFGSTNK